jgi:hypothetical protein
VVMVSLTGDVTAIAEPSVESTYCYTSQSPRFCEILLL